MTIDIYSGGKYPANALSNFAAHTFEFRGFTINSMEGFIAGLTYKDPIEQMRIFLLTGLDAKNATKPWQYSLQVYWQGHVINRCSQEYQDLFDEAYDALYANADFRKALELTKGKEIRHTMGSKDRMRTLLTEQEFVGRLKRLRDSGHSKEIKYSQDELF